MAAFFKSKVKSKHIVIIKKYSDPNYSFSFFVLCAHNGAHIEIIQNEIIDYYSFWLYLHVLVNNTNNF